MPGCVLRRVELSGFRGFVGKQEILCGDPLTLLFGANRNGKSSIINAIEWCLFGPEAAAIKYGDIRERDAWEVKNLKSPGCYVRCEFQAPSGQKIVASRKYRTARTSEFSFEIEGETKGTDEKSLWAHLRISPADFVSSVHLHPEVIRSLVVAKPKDRKEAIDRLLGLSELREIADCFASEKPSGWTAEMNNEVALLEQRLVAALQQKQNTIRSESTELAAKGVPEANLTAEGAVTFATEVCGKIREFADRYGLPEPALTAPKIFEGVQSLRTNLPSAIKKLREGHPILADRGQHLNRKNLLDGLKTSYVNQLGRLTAAEQNLGAYPEKRTIQEIEAEIAALTSQIGAVSDQMAAVSRNAAILDSALKFFESQPGTESANCPLCGETTWSMGEWRAHIGRELEAASLGPLQNRKTELEAASRSLEKARSDIAGLLAKVEEAKRPLDKITVEIGREVGRPIAPTDDPVAVLNQAISVIDKTLETLEDQAAEINAVLDAFQQEILDLDRFERIGRAQLEIKRIEAIEQNEGYQQLKAARTRCEQYAEDVDLLIEGLRSAVRIEAEKRLKLAQQTIAGHFKALTNRPDFPTLRVSPSGDGYMIELVSGPGDVKAAVPLLNHADLNCAALAIFLALGGSEQISHRLGFIILDDPSQSLDATCKANLCAVLTALCDVRQVILATADSELRDEASRMTKSKMVYVVKNWTPDSGPVVEIADAAHAI